MGGQTATKASTNSRAEGTGQRSQPYASQYVPSGPYADVLALQRSAGNRAVTQVLEAEGGNRPPTGNIHEDIQTSVNKRLGPLPSANASAVDAKFASVRKRNDLVHEALPLSSIVQRKCACGNHTMAGGECQACSKKKRLGLQTKLKVNEPGDIYEQEADRIADHVMATPSRSAGSDAPPRIQRLSGQPNGQIDAAPDSVDRTLASPGRPLEADLRQDMEQRLGHDFSQVRVHSRAMAEQSARDVNANAYTVGHNVVFGAGRFAPQTQEGRRLIAHELTHVVQQSRSQLPIITATRPGLVQRQTGQAARAKVEEAMKKLTAKFGLAEVTEENGATWNESELAKVDAAFSKVSKEDQPLLKNLHLVRTDKFEPLVRGGKTFKIAGETLGTGTIKLAKEAFQGDASTILHEVGHLIQNKVAAAMLEKSKAKFDLEAARLMLEERRKKAPTRVGQEVQAFIAAFNQVTAAAVDFMGSGEEDRAAKQSALDDAKMQADMARFEVGRLKNDDVATAWLQAHDRQQKWVEAVEKYIEEFAKKNLTGFIDVVTKNGLAQKKYVPFTDYVAAHWPAKPQEFFAQAFHTWRTNPNYMKRKMQPLFDWFEKGGHREGKGYVESKGAIETVREVAPELYDLGKTVQETLWPKEFQDLVKFARNLKARASNE